MTHTRPQFGMADSHRYGTINYIKPKCFELPSTGSLPCGAYNHKDVCEGQGPAIVTDIEKVRVTQTPTPRLTVNLSPWEHGQLTARAGKGEKNCPYEPLTDNYFEWMDGYEEYRV